jgi:hypothetical protein
LGIVVLGAGIVLYVVPLFQAVGDTYKGFKSLSHGPNPVHVPIVARPHGPTQKPLIPESHRRKHGY